MKQESWQEQVKRLRENKKRNEQNVELMRKLHTERIEKIRKVQDDLDRARKHLKGEIAKASI